jgi:hypothetical protein
MQSLKSLAEDVIRQSQAGKLNARTIYLRTDPAINVHIILNDQQIELLRLKGETLAHVWINSKLEVVPLDGEFDQLQLQIAALDGKIAINAKVASDLDKAFHDLQIEPPHSFDEQIREIGGQIERKKQELADKLAPYRATHADMDKIPEVIQAREETAAMIAALESEARVIETKLARIHEILRGVVR